jgi:hypothetical protein
MTEPAQYGHDNRPMKDILSEIRDMVSRETQARYDEAPPKPKLLVLRPEARVDDVPKPPAPVTAKELEDSLEEEVFKIKLRESFGISEAGELEDLIRKVLREELKASR